MPVQWRARIALDATSSPPRAYIRGTHVLVATILEELADSSGFDDVLSRHPELSSDDVRAALAYSSELVRETILSPSAYVESRFLRHFYT
jgi:uncharacterized protein (DUF433 family)